MLLLNKIQSFKNLEKIKLQLQIIQMAVIIQAVQINNKVQIIQKHQV